MAANDLLLNFASELSTRLEQFGFKRRPLTIESDGREKYCTVARLRVVGARSNIFAFQGP